MEELFKCPLCESNSLSMAFKTFDYFLTKEQFQVTKCDSCGFLFTNKRPLLIELSRYYQSDDYLSHNTSKKTITSFIYSIFRSISIRKKYRLIRKFKKKGKILDIGCGTGELLNYFKNRGWETLGIEPADNPRDFAVSQFGLSVFPEEKLNSLIVGEFDVITMWHVLEHVAGLDERIEQVKKLLKPDGLLIVALPNSQSWDAQYYKNFWAAWDLPRHLYHFTSYTFNKLIDKHNLKIDKIHPMIFDSFYVCLLSEKYKTGQTKYLRAFINGFRSNISALKNSGNYSSLIFTIHK